MTNIAEKIDLLFKTITRPDGKEYSYRDIEELSGDAISGTAIWKVRTGQTKNPTPKLLQALSQAFEVPLAYFSQESVSPEDVPAFQAQYQSDQMVEQIALRASKLDDEGKQAILDMIDLVSKYQKTDEP